MDGIVGSIDPFLHEQPTRALDALGDDLARLRERIGSDDALERGVGHACLDRGLEHQRRHEPIEQLRVGATAQGHRARDRQSLGLGERVERGLVGQHRHDRRRGSRSRNRSSSSVRKLDTVSTARSSVNISTGRAAPGIASARSGSTSARPSRLGTRTNLQWRDQRPGHRCVVSSNTVGTPPALRLRTTPSALSDPPTTTAGIVSVIEPTMLLSVASREQVIEPSPHRSRPAMLACG